MALFVAALKRRGRRLSRRLETPTTPIPLISLGSALRRARSRGQAMIELALSLGILLPFAFMILAVWGIFFATSNYSQASQALTSWIAHRGAYTTGGDCSDPVSTDMYCSMQRQLEGVNGISNDGIYLYVNTILPDGSSGPSTGIHPAAFPETDSVPSVPADIGWTTELRCLPAGTHLDVIIYGYSEVSIPMLPVYHWRMVVGAASAEVLRDGGEPCD